MKDYNNVPVESAAQQELLCLKRTMPLPIDDCRADHVYNKRPCIDEETALTNSAHVTVQPPSVNDRHISCNAEIPGQSIAELDSQSQDISLSQATDSLSQFIASKNGDDKTLIHSMQKRVRRLTRQLKLAQERSATLKKNLSRFLNTTSLTV
jgi:hypothetical protein